MNTKVSIIIPLYNAEQYIEQAVDSCLNQTYEDIEVIVIDDGSTDNSKSTINHYIREDKIKYVYQSNQERSVARNHGLNIATGEYINFLDSDDLLHKTKIEKQVTFLEKNKGWFATYSAVEYFSNKTGDKISIPTKEHNNGDLIDDLLLGNFIPIQSVLFRKNSIRFDENINALEDWHYFLNTFFEKNIFFIQDTLSSVRIDVQLSNNYLQNMRWGEIQVYLKLLKDDKFKSRKPKIIKMLILKFLRYFYSMIIKNIRKDRWY